jgi:hypothetical protein
MDPGKIGYGVGAVDWVSLAQDRENWKALVNAVMKLQVPKNAGNFSTGCKTGGFSSSDLLQFHAPAS